ncbi:MAG: hypothetical protein ABI594_18070 [Ginsengibacter sp.]
MHLPDFFRSISRKTFILIAGIIIALAIVFFIWERNKYKIVKDTIAETIAKKTDGLYTVKYDSLHFDEILGTAYLKNIHITADTNRIKNTKLEDRPYILLDIKIASLNVTGVKTDKALLGQQMVGDSIVITDPVVIVYFVKPVNKKTNLNTEATVLYDEILGNLKLIKVGQMFINNVNVKGVGFAQQEKAFDFANGNIQLKDILIDSTHNLDTSRTLFCKEANLQVASFITYNNNRPELRVNNLDFNGQDNTIAFEKIAVNRFDDGDADSSKLLMATGLELSGLDANEFVKNKNIIVENITCKHITLYEPPLQSLKSTKKAKPLVEDTTGFRHAYSIDMRHLNFPHVTYIPQPGSRYTIGNVGIKINTVKADEIMKVQKHPIDFSNEVEFSCAGISMNSKDGLYKYSFDDIVLNSLRKELNLGSYNIKPAFGEKEFADKMHFQKDRYDVTLKGIALKGINMRTLIDKKIIASDLTVSAVNAKIYRDLRKPLNDESKVGHYPSQLLGKIEIPINIAHATLSNAYIEYREKEKLSDSTGNVKFTESTLRLSNVTNVPEAIKDNNSLKISFESKALGTIPINGSFIFSLNDTAGNFVATGNIPSFDAHLLNKVSVPMALMRINTGQIDAIDFKFDGNNYGAGGNMIMKYSNLKVDVLKRDEDTKEVKKKGLTSFLANFIVKNDNPRNGDLRKVEPHYDRDVRKSFFNLVWKTIFTGIKKTVGIPGGG